MKRIINIDKTFQAIRQLPLAVSYEQVEHWVKQQPALHSTKPTNAKSWLSHLLGRFSNN